MESNVFMFVLCCVDICGCRLNIVNGRCMRDEVICGVNGIVYVLYDWNWNSDEGL